MDFIGKYQHEKSENLDGFFKSVGVPYLIRIMITRSNPDMEIEKVDDEVWKISLKSLFRTGVRTFKLGEEYMEDMSGANKLKSITTLENKKLITNSENEDGTQKTKSVYELSDTHVVQTLTHIGTGQEAKRYFRKVSE